MLRRLFENTISRYNTGWKIMLNILEMWGNEIWRMEHWIVTFARRENYYKVIQACSFVFLQSSMWKSFGSRCQSQRLKRADSFRLSKWRWQMKFPQERDSLIQNRKGNLQPPPPLRYISFLLAAFVVPLIYLSHWFMCHVVLARSSHQTVAYLVSQIIIMIVDRSVVVKPAQQRVKKTKSVEKRNSFAIYRWLCSYMLNRLSVCTFVNAKRPGFVEHTPQPWANRPLVAAFESSLDLLWRLMWPAMRTRTVR